MPCFGGKRKAKGDPQQRKKAIRTAAAAAYADKGHKALCPLSQLADPGILRNS
eukprot:COSAG06_NODE_1_length_58652_cov_31.600967_26_plen_53_part_00